MGVVPPCVIKQFRVWGMGAPARAAKHGAPRALSNAIHATSPRPREHGAKAVEQRGQARAIRETKCAQYGNLPHAFWCGVLRVPRRQTKYRCEIGTFGCMTKYGGCGVCARAFLPVCVNLRPRIPA